MGIKISRSYIGRDYRRIWVHEYYRRIKINNKIIKKWIESHWRKRYIKEISPKL